MTYLKTGVVTAKLGARREAIADYRAAQQLLEELLEHDPQNSHLQSQLALSRNNMALLLAAEGETAAALREYELAIIAQKKLAAEHLEKPELACQLAESYLNRGTLLGQSGKIEDAEASLNQAINVLAASYATETKSIELTRSLTMAHNNLAFLLRVTEPERALQQANIAVEVLERACHTPNVTRDALADLALCYANRAAIQNSLQKTDEAIDSYRRSIELRESLVRTSPGIVHYRSELAAALNNVALLYIQTDQKQAADQAFSRANRLFAELLEDHPQQISYASGWAALFNNQGLALAKVDRLETAIKAYRQAVAVQQQVWQTLPESDTVRDSLSRIYFNFARALRLNGRSEEAFQVALSRRELWPHNGGKLFSVALELAAIATNDTAENLDVAAEELSGTLTQALNAGYQPEIDFKNDQRFRAFRDHPKFRELLANNPTEVASFDSPATSINP